MPARQTTWRFRQFGYSAASGNLPMQTRYVTDLEPMTRGPKPLGNKALTAAERQARFRASHAKRGAPDQIPKSHRPPQPGATMACGGGRAHRLTDNYRRWLHVLPQNLEASATAEALRAICDLDLSDLQSVEPPRGFGRD